MDEKLTDKNIRSIGWILVKSSEYWQQYSTIYPEGEVASLMVFNTGFAHLDIIHDSASVEKFSIDWLRAAMQALKIPILENTDIPLSPESVHLARAVELLQNVIDGIPMYEEVIGSIRAFLEEVKKGGEDEG